MKRRKFTLILLVLIGCGFLLTGSQPQIDNNFFNFLAKISADTAGQRVVNGNDGWYFLHSELSHIAKKLFWGDKAAAVSVYKKAKDADPLPAIIDFYKQLKERNIELILVPVPTKAAVYPEKLDKTLSVTNNKRLDYFHYEFIQLLKNEGITVIDLMPVFLQKRSGTNSVYCRTDSHWSSYGCELAAGEITAHIKSAPWYSSIDKISVQAIRKKVKISGDLVDDTQTEELEMRFVTDSAGNYIESSDQSPVILLGDSHTLVFHEGGDMLSKGAGLADQLAYDLKTAVDLIGVRGSGSTASRINMLRKTRSNPDYLSAKKAVIWCFTVREFTESTGGWKKVPVSR
jgi:hypothetical protein